MSCLVVLTLQEHILVSSGITIDIVYYEPDSNKSLIPRLLDQSFHYTIFFPLLKIQQNLSPKNHWCTYFTSQQHSWRPKNRNKYEESSLDLMSIEVHSRKPRQPNWEHEEEWPSSSHCFPNKSHHEWQIWNNFEKKENKSVLMSQLQICLSKWKQLCK
jgi:hypothetical protein